MVSLSRCRHRIASALTPRRPAGVMSVGMVAALFVVAAPVRTLAAQVLDFGEGDARVGVVDPDERRAIAQASAELDLRSPQTRLGRAIDGVARGLLRADDPVRLLLGLQLAAAGPGIDDLAAAVGDPPVGGAPGLRTAREAVDAERVPSVAELDALLAEIAAMLEIDREPFESGRPAEVAPVRDEPDDELVDLVEFLPERIDATWLAQPEAAEPARAAALVAWAERRGAGRRERLLAAARLVRIARRIDGAGWLGEARVERFVATTRRLIDDLVANAEIQRDAARRLDRLELASTALAQATALSPRANERRLLRDAVDAVPPDAGDEAVDLRGVRILVGVLDRAVARRTYRDAGPPSDLPDDLRPTLAAMWARGDRIERELLARLPGIVADPAVASEPALYGRLVDQSILLRDLERLHDRGRRVRRWTEPIDGAGVGAEVIRAFTAAMDDALRELVLPSARTAADGRLRRLERAAAFAAPFPLERSLRAGEVSVLQDAGERGPRLAAVVASVRGELLGEWSRGDGAGGAVRAERVATLLSMLEAFDRVTAGARASGRDGAMLVPGRWFVPADVSRRWTGSAGERLRRGLRAIESGEHDAMDRRLPADASAAAAWQLAASFDDPWVGSARALGRRMLERAIGDVSDPAAARASLDLLEAAARSGEGEREAAARWLSSAQRAASASERITARRDGGEPTR